MVTLEPGAKPPRSELRAFVAERLAAFKVPVKILFPPRDAAAQPERQADER